MNIFELKSIKLKTNFTEFFLSLLIFLYPFLFIWQCGDLTDTGFFALNYQNFFENLQIGKTNSITFLTDFLGATWFRLFPTFGIVGLKFLYLIFLYLILFFTYLILKIHTKKRTLLLLGILCAVVFSERFSMFIFSRDIASWFFLIISSYLIIIGLNRQKFLFIYFSGVFFALACLCRFPNIVLIVILPLMFFYINFYGYKYITRLNFLIFFKEYFIFLIGFLSVAAFFWGLLKYYFLTQTFLLNLDFLGTQNKTSYSSISLMKSYIYDLVIFIPHVLIVSSLILTTSLIFNYSKITKKISPIVVCIILLFCLAFLIYRGFSYSSNLKYLIPALCFLPLLFSLIKKDKFSNVVIVMLTMSLTQVAGTNTGLFLKLCYGFIVLLPLSIVIIGEQKKIVFENILINTRPILIYAVYIILFFCILARIGWIYHVDSGLSCRLKAIYPINNNLMKGIFTTQKNATHIKELCNSIKSNIKEENTLFIFGHEPMFYYLTKHQPPVKKFWLTNNLVQIDELFLSINESIKLTGKWPMIVDTKQKIMGDIGEKKLAEFLKDNNYIRIENKYDFSIWNKMPKRI